jgi:hypothetical protein
MDRRLVSCGGHRRDAGCPAQGGRRDESHLGGRPKHLAHHSAGNIGESLREVFGGKGIRDGDDEHSL